MKKRRRKKKQRIFPLLKAIRLGGISKTTAYRWLDDDLLTRHVDKTGHVSLDVNEIIRARRAEPQPRRLPVRRGKMPVPNSDKIFSFHGALPNPKEAE